MFLITAFILSLSVTGVAKAEKASFQTPQFNSYYSLSNDSLNEKNRVNPDGYCNRFSFNIKSGYGSRGLLTDDDLSFIFLSINPLLPVTSKFSIGLHADIWLSKFFECRIYLKPKFYTKEINNFSYLNNPDGLLHSFIISPVLGLDKSNLWSTHPFYNFYFGCEGGFVVSRKFTINIRHLLNIQTFYEYFGSRFELIIEPVFHIYRISRNFLNPDGKKGTITIKPAFKFIFGNNSLFAISHELTIPLCRKLSCSVTLDAISMKTFDILHDEYRIHAGMAFFP